LGSEREPVAHATLHRDADREAHPRTDASRFLAILELVALGGGGQATHHCEAGLRRQWGGKGQKDCQGETRAKLHCRTSDGVRWPQVATGASPVQIWNVASAPYGKKWYRFQQYPPDFHGWLTFRPNPLSEACREDPRPPVHL